MPWLQLTFTVSPPLADRLADALTALGALSVTFQDGADQPIYEPPLNTTPLWQHTQVIGLFEATQQAEAIALALAADFPDLLLARVEQLDDQDWVRLGMADFHPMRFGERLWVCPSWETPPQPEAVNIVLDPGLAFGTGTHPTTALCLTWLDAQAVAGKTVIDYGCGSGILAIAALKLGAACAWGVDNDPQALHATHDNAANNGVAAALQVVFPEQVPPLQADILLANILANPLCELAPHLASLVRPGGGLALSGILQAQSAQVSLAYAPYFEMSPAVSQEDWVCLAGRRNMTPTSAEPLV